MNAPWWTFPRIDNFGTIDPQGPYYKPDSNIQIPGGYPVTALLPGTVTSLQDTSYGQKVVTIKLDRPLNSLATHTFYEHLSSFSSIQVGQHVSSGELIGYNNPQGQVPLGFGLYPGDVYGQGAGWNQLQQDLAPGGAGLLNPTNLLNTYKSGGSVGVVGSAVNNATTTVATTAQSALAIGASQALSTQGILSSLEPYITGFVDIVIVGGVAVVLGFMGFKLMTSDMHIGDKVKSAVEKTAKVATHI